MPKCKNQNSIYHLLLLLYGNLNLSPSPVYQNLLQCSNEWKALNNNG